MDQRYIYILFRSYGRDSLTVVGVFTIFKIYLNRVGFRVITLPMEAPMPADELRDGSDCIQAIQEAAQARG